MNHRVNPSGLVVKDVGLRPLVAGIACSNPAGCMDLLLVLRTSGRDSCDGLITRPEGSYRMCVCVCVCVTECDKMQQSPSTPAMSTDKRSDYERKKDIHSVTNSLDVMPICGSF
jgi:hypothetical protein